MATAGGHSPQMNPTLIQTLSDRGEGLAAAFASTYVPGFGKIDGNLRDTIVHEGTHQVAFNTGLHVRFGANPTWIVEGLATVFESPGIRNRSLRGSAKDRINHERFGWFQNFSKKRRKQKSLEEFIINDDMFKQATLDAYSQAWALTFFLVETRPRKFARLLKKIAARDPLKVYTGKERLNDFKNVFGDRLVLLEAEFLRFIKRVK